MGNILSLFASEVEGKLPNNSTNNSNKVYECKKKIIIQLIL